MHPEAVVHVRRLRKAYKQVVAVDEISFEVFKQEIFGMVGPNGAGKTTTIECIEGLRHADAGEVRVLGLDPHQEAYALRPKIGVQLQEAALQDRIRVWEVLDLFTSFYPRSRDWKTLLQQLGLGKNHNVPFSKLSGGQKQRLFIALALVNDPQVVFLDELTTGLDPQARRTMWDLVREIRNEGKTVFLTTHYMEEAERLCDRVAIIDQGRIVALDSPENLIRNLGAEHRVVFSFEETLDEERLGRLENVTNIEVSGDRVIVYGHSENLVADVVNFLTSNRVRFRDLRTEQPTLEDVFLSLTGHKMRD